MLHRPLPLIVAAALVAPAFAHAAESKQEAAARDIIKRYAPGLADSFVLETIPAVQGCDTYEIESVNGRIVLRGNSGVALSSAFYHYIKEFCRGHMSWNGDNLGNLPATAPAVPAKIRVTSPVKVRMAYNYCVHGYTMPFWDKDKWNREIDWLALHGINLALIIQGQDAVWQNTFTQFGYTKDEVRQWLCSPALQPWQFMQNMQGVMSPPQSIIDYRTDIGRHIVNRCRSLGIEPLLQGYYGMVPTGFAKKHPQAKIHGQGVWAGGLPRPDMLNPGDPLFPKIAKTFMEEQRKIYGGDIRFLAADPFHEGGSDKGMSRGVVYKQVQDAILAFNPNATLVKQCWQTSNKEMFDAGIKDKSLALDLWCDKAPFWKKAKGYDGTPWGWSLLFNFGGNTGMEGRPVQLAKDFGAALADPGRGRLEATLIAPEGSGTSPILYELMSEMGWRGAPADPLAWIQNYLHSRYGKKNADVDAAWAILLDTAYAIRSTESPINSVIQAKPALNDGIKGRTWCDGCKIPYDNRKLYTAWATLQKAAPELGAVDTYRFDLADVARQTLTNLARPIHLKIITAAKTKNLEELRLQSKRMRELIADLDELTGTRRDWLMGVWTDDARKWGKNSADVAYMDRTARMMLTTWIPDPNTNLADYANRDWNGLLSQYYGKRWELFLDTVETAVAAGKQPDMNAYNKKRAEFESSWVSANKPDMLTEPKGDTLAVSAKLLAKYADILPAYYGGAPLVATKEAVTGVWKYHAENRDLYRELRADGTVHAYDAAGKPLNWFDGYTWSVKNGDVVLTKGGNAITMQLVGKDLLDFTSEGFGPSTRAEAPGK